MNRSNDQYAKTNAKTPLSKEEKTASVKKQHAELLAKLGESLHKDTIGLKSRGIIPVLTFEVDGTPKAEYLKAEDFVGIVIPMSDVREMQRIERTTKKQLESGDCEELDDIKIEKQKERTHVLQEAGYTELPANPKTRQRLITGAAEIIKAEGLLETGSCLEKHLQDHPGEKAQVNYFKAIIAKKIMIQKKKLQKGAKEEDWVKLARDLKFKNKQDVLAARLMSLKQYSKKTMGNSITRRLTQGESQSAVLQEAASIMENSKKTTPAAKATEIEKALKEHEIYELNCSVNFWEDRELQRAKLDKLTDIFKAKKGNYLDILDAEFQSIAFCIFSKSLGSDYTASGLTEKEKADNATVIREKMEEKDSGITEKQAMDLIRAANNQAMLEKVITSDQWTNGSMIATIIRKAEAVDEKTAKSFEAMVIKEINARRETLSNENRANALASCPEQPKFSEKKNYGNKNFFTDSVEKKKRMFFQKKTTVGFADPKSCEIFKRIQSAAKAINSEKAPAEIKKELAMAPMRIGSEMIRNQALLSVLQVFASYAAEQDDLDDWD